TMGRKTGWLAYGVAIAGEANLVVAVEDVRGKRALQQSITDPDTGEQRTVDRLDMPALVDHIVDLILAREKRGKHYGTVVLAEGIAELLPKSFVEGMPRDEHGHLSLGRMDLGK